MADEVKDNPAQVESDMALAQALQLQESIMRSRSHSDAEFDAALRSSGAVAAPPLETPADFARALREAEERTARLLARLRQYSRPREDDEDDEDDDDSDEEAEDLDPDNMSYEELIALGEAMGSQSKGLSPSTIAELPVSSFKKDGRCWGTSSDCELCVICRHDYEAEESVLTLPCKHRYHSQCIQQWLQINKICPVCSAEVAPF